MDVLEFEAAEVNDDRVPDVTEIINYISAINHGLAEIKTREITIDLLDTLYIGIFLPFLLQKKFLVF